MKNITNITTGYAAIDLAESDETIQLNKFNDPVENAREDITANDARSIAKEDASLIYATRRAGLKNYKATITENGNGLPSIGEICYDSSTDTVYTITGGCSHISTNGPGRGNSVEAILEDRGSASDTTDEEWETIESNNYGVAV